MTFGVMKAISLRYMQHLKRYSSVRKNLLKKWLVTPVHCKVNRHGSSKVEFENTISIN